MSPLWPVRRWSRQTRAMPLLQSARRGSITSGTARSSLDVRHKLPSRVLLRGSLEDSLGQQRVRAALSVHTRFWIQRCGAVKGWQSSPPCCSWWCRALNPFSSSAFSRARAKYPHGTYCCRCRLRKGFCYGRRAWTAGAAPLRFFTPASTAAGASCALSVKLRVRFAARLSVVSQPPPASTAARRCRCVCGAST